MLEILTNKFYGISDKSHKLQKLYQQYLTDRDQIEIVGQAFNHDLDTLKTMIAYNSALLISGTQVRMSDADYGTWLEENPQTAIAAPQDAAVAQVFNFLADATAGTLVGHLVKNLGSTIKKKTFKKYTDWRKKKKGSGSQDDDKEGDGDGTAPKTDSNQDAGGRSDTDADADKDKDTDSDSDSDSELDTEGGSTVAEEGSSTDVPSLLEDGATAGDEAGLTIDGQIAAESLTKAGATVTDDAIDSASMGALGYGALAGAIVLAIGVDAIISTIESAQAADKLEDETDKLQKALDKVDAYLDALNKNRTQVQDGIVKQEQAFQKVMKLLNAIQPSWDSDWVTLQPTYGNASKYLVAMTLASTQYNRLQVIKSDWTSFVETGTPDWNLFVMLQLRTSPPPKPGTLGGFTQQQVQELLDYAAQFSEQMTQAKLKAKS